jgi:DNA-directed RNA polymerase specialized sigma24 family protein
MLRPAYTQLLDLARRASRSADAEDLLQDALIEALRTGRSEFSLPENRRWLFGVIRNKARMSARSAVRRRDREANWHPTPTGPEAAPDTAVLAGLPPSLKAVAALALGGHNRREIAYLLRLDDAALRQRIRQLRKRLAVAGVAMPSGFPGLKFDLAYGRIRDALLPALVQQGGVFASHDPDGHLIVFASSQKQGSRQLQAQTHGGRDDPETA